MKKFIHSVLIILSISALTGCAEFLGEPSSADLRTASSQKASSAINFPEIENWLMRNNLSITGGRAENDYNRAFAQGSVVIYGEGSAAMNANPAQKRLGAMRAAEVVAQRNLADFFAEKARGGELRFTSYTTRLESFIQGASVAVSDYDSGTGRAAVLLKLDLRGAKDFAPYSR